MTTGLPTRPRLPAVLLGIAVAATIPVFWIVVVPVLTGAARPAHADHWPWLLLHAVCGTLILVTGPLGLYIGWTRRGFAWHRHVGCVYIAAGMTNALAALVMVIQQPAHGRPPGVALSSAMLAAAWLIAAGAGWYAATDRRYDDHRDWMIRSYVLTWTFVFCRLAQRVESFDWLGPIGSAVGIWLYWVGPLIICEAALRWRDRITSPRGSA